MICINELTEQKCHNQQIISDFTILLSPYAPHIAEEIWEKMGNKDSITKASFPKYNDSYLVEDKIKYPISFNGKTRFTISLPADMTKEQIENAVMNYEKTNQYLIEKTPKKIIVVPGRIINVVI